VSFPHLTTAAGPAAARSATQGTWHMGRESHTFMSHSHTPEHQVREALDTGGFVCVRASKCKVRGGANTTAIGGGNSGIELARQVLPGQLLWVDATGVLAARIGSVRGCVLLLMEGEG
jgi:hypothetical protein